MHLRSVALFRASIRTRTSLSRLRMSSKVIARVLERTLHGGSSKGLSSGRLHSSRYPRVPVESAIPAIGGGKAILIPQSHEWSFP